MDLTCHSLPQFDMTGSTNDASEKFAPTSGLGRVFLRAQQKQAWMRIDVPLAVADVVWSFTAGKARRRFAACDLRAKFVVCNVCCVWFRCYAHAASATLDVHPCCTCGGGCVLASPPLNPACLFFGVAARCDAWLSLGVCFRKWNASTGKVA